MAMGIMQRALDGVKSRKDTTPTLDAQVVDLPAENKNEKQIAIQRPDNDEDKNVNLPVASGGNGLVPPNQTPTDLAALGGDGTLAPIGNRDVAEDVEFTINNEEPEGIEGYKQAGESWHTSEEEEQPKIEQDEKPAIEDKSEKEQPKIKEDEKLALEDKSGIGEYEDVGTLKDPADIGEYEDVGTIKLNNPEDNDDEDKKKKKDKDEDEDNSDDTNGVDLLNSGATDFSINDIVESEQEIPHYQYRSLLNRR